MILLIACHVLPSSSCNTCYKICVHYEQQAACESFYVILIKCLACENLCLRVLHSMSYHGICCFLLCRVGFGLLAHSLLASCMIVVSVKTELLSVYGVMRSSLKISYRFCN